MSDQKPRPKTSPRTGAKAEALFDREIADRIKSDLASGLGYPARAPAAPRARARAPRPGAAAPSPTIQPMDSIYLRIADE